MLLMGKRPLCLERLHVENREQRRRVSSIRFGQQKLSRTKQDYRSSRDAQALIWKTIRPGFNRFCDGSIFHTGWNSDICMAAAIVNDGRSCQNRYLSRG